jgi:hypothetical protein
MTAPTNKLDVGAMMTDELKRCPFCGAHATAPQNITPTKRATWEVSCAIFCVAIRRGSRKEVVESWNKRALLSASKPAVMQTEELYGKQMCKKRIVYAAPQPAQTERALTDAQREAIGWACGASKHSGAPEVASYHQIFEKMLSAAQPASGVDHE